MNKPVLSVMIDPRQMRESLIEAGLLKPRPKIRFHEVTDRDPTPKSRINHANVFRLDDAGKAAATKHVAQFRSGHGDFEHRDAFDDRPTRKR
jgi:hypothetical protein